MGECGRINLQQEHKQAPVISTSSEKAVQTASVFRRQQAQHADRQQTIINNILTLNVIKKLPHIHNHFNGYFQVCQGSLSAQRLRFVPSSMVDIQTHRQTAFLGAYMNSSAS